MSRRHFRTDKGLVFSTMENELKLVSLDHVFSLSGSNASVSTVDRVSHLHDE